VIPIAKPYLGEAELAALAGPVRDGWLVQGPRVAEFERRFAAVVGAEHAVATTSCTTALHVAVAALRAGPGDEVVVPAFTWVATANAVAYTGATPVLCDIALDTYNLDPDALAAAITPRTVGIVPVHLFGRLAEPATLARAGLWIVEDAACAFGARRAGVHAGRWGAAGCFSFHPRKSITTGEGGMLVTGDAELAGLARALRDHGGTRPDHARHASDRPWVMGEYAELGFNYRMTDLQGALGCAQLDRADWLLAERARLAGAYTDALAELAWLRTPKVPAGETHGWQSYVCLYTGEDREGLMRRLQAGGVSTRAGTLALHQTALYRQPDAAFPAAAEAARRTLALPLYPGLTDAEQAQVIEALLEAGP
jgi:dTDP-4-amino-4,6-dideoxygalactose transaminase